MVELCDESAAAAMREIDPFTKAGLLLVVIDAGLSVSGLTLQRHVEVACDDQRSGGARHWVVEVEQLVCDESVDTRTCFAGRRFEEPPGDRERAHLQRDEQWALGRCDHERVPVRITGTVRSTV